MRKQIAILSGLMLLSVAAYAGGRARIVNVQAPREVTAGESFQLSFVVKPEVGRRNVEPMVTASFGDRVVSIPAVATRTKDRYAATVALPEAGNWKLRVDSRFCHTVMEPVKVRAVARTKS